MGLELRFLGGVEVVRDGKALSLPPSKKTRALLAYLALQGRSFSREHLCELLWEIPDDPRGSLRWSLSKLRRLVDDESTSRIIADRASVQFSCADIEIDVIALKQLVENRLESASLAELEAAAERFQGNFLEGLDLSNFHAFHAFCVSEREAVTRAQSSLLQALVTRLNDKPEKAIPAARKWASISPYDEVARATLIRLLVRDGLIKEAEQQYRLGTRLLKEVGRQSSDILFRAFRGAPGQSDSVEPDAAKRVSTVTAPVPRTHSNLIGRDEELAAIEALLTNAENRNTPRLFLILGAPGMGKSRLLQAAEVMAGQQGAMVLFGKSFETAAIRPFAMWMDSLRRLDQAATLNIFASDQEDSRDRLFDRLSSFIGKAAKEQALVLLFDDLQWCDESSAAALHFVARMNPDCPITCILAARADELRDNTAVQKALRALRGDGVLSEMPLSPLSDTVIQALIKAEAPETDCAILSTRCAGNPLLAIELARAETAGDSPSSLHELVRERLERFDVNGAEIMRWASIVTPRIDIPLLAQVTGLSVYAVSDSLELAERHGLLAKADSGFGFLHELIAGSIYSDISPARRQIMHRRIAELLEGTAALDVNLAADLSHHAAQSGDAGLAARAMVSAGRLCLRFFANGEALSLAQKGLVWARALKGADQVKVTLDLHEVILSAAPLEDWEAASHDYVALADRALDFGAFAHARLGYHMASYLRWMHGNWVGAREQTLQAERATRSGSDEEHIVGMAETAKCLAMIERDLAQADAMLMEAQALATRKRLSHHAIPAALGMLRYHENCLDEAEELFREARTLCKSVGARINEFQAMEYIVMINIERGRFDVAREHSIVLQELGENIREGSEAPFARAMAGLCEYALGNSDSALDIALEELRVADAKHRLAYTLTRAALIDLERNEPGRAVARASEGLGYAELLERASEVMMARVVLARACRALEDVPNHRDHVRVVQLLSTLPIAAWAHARANHLLESTAND